MFHIISGNYYIIVTLVGMEQWSSASVFSLVELFHYERSSLITTYVVFLKIVSSRYVKLLDL